MTRPRVPESGLSRGTEVVIVVDHQDDGALERAVGAALTGLRHADVGWRTFAVQPARVNAVPARGFALLVANASALNPSDVGGLASRGALVAIGSTMRSGEPGTAIDTLGWLKAGARGVMEASAFVLPEALAMAVVRGTDARSLIGSPARQLVDFHDRVVEDWPSDDEGDLDHLCFRAAVALAQLPVLRPAPSGRRNNGFPQLAIGLNGFRELTGFSHNTHDLRHALSRLTRLWTPDDEVDLPVQRKSDRELVERSRLPDLARQEGFPRHVPEIPGVDRAAVASELYWTLAGMRIEVRDPVAGLARAEVVIDVRGRRATRKGNGE